jgi:thioredoxin 1
VTDEPIFEKINQFVGDFNVCLLELLLQFSHFLSKEAVLLLVGKGFWVVELVEVFLFGGEMVLGISNQLGEDLRNTAHVARVDCLAERVDQGEEALMLLINLGNLDAILSVPFEHHIQPTVFAFIYLLPGVCTFWPGSALQQNPFKQGRFFFNQHDEVIFMALDITPENFDEVKKGKAILDFWAPWCGPCQMFKPIFEEVAGEMEGITFGKVNTEEEANASLAGQFGVRGIPTVVFLKDGEEVSRFSGAYPKEKFVEEIKKQFGE